VKAEVASGGSDAADAAGVPLSARIEALLFEGESAADERVTHA
jgi:hypothetical protein